MNSDLVSLIEIYSTKNHQAVSSYLLEKSKDNIISILTDLLTMYINDKNSSSIREFITVSLSGYKHAEKKIGYNGYKQSSFDSEVRINCEAKPQNIRSLDKKSRKLNGGGNFYRLHL